jgi:hypothetical protein
MADSAGMSPLDEIRAAQDGCTWDICHFNYAYFQYRPNRAANLTFAALFGISMLAYLAQGALSKKWVGFTIAMVAGCTLEVIGYTGRFAAYKDMWHEVCSGRRAANNMKIYRVKGSIPNSNLLSHYCPCLHCCWTL